MSKDYLAFISYRHVPADIKVAESLHRKIEHYRIPRGLDLQGRRRLGRVFRDKEELPLSVSLTDSIHEALDHSEYLIVVCSPETPKSMWVREEIRYFLRHHDIDHVLEVLIDGEISESFPPELLHLYDEDGTTVLQDIEPIAADIRAASPQAQKRLASREFLRIYARMLNCDFDDLYRREQRYQTRRALALAALVATVSAVFIGMLLNRNAEIHQQMLNAKRNESEALVSASRAAYRSGDYRDAINKALDALPGRDPDRPYVPEAQLVLSDEMFLYRHNKPVYTQSVDQETAVWDICASAEKHVFVTLDRNGVLRTYDECTGQLLWEDHTYGTSNCFIEIIDHLNALLVCSFESVTPYCYTVAALSLSDGSLLWEQDNYEVINVSEDQSVALCSRTEGVRKEHYCLMNLEDGCLRDCISIDGRHWTIAASAVSEDLRFAAVLVNDYDTEESCFYLYVLDYLEMTWKALPEKYFIGNPLLYYDAALCFDPENNLLLATSETEKPGEDYDNLLSYVICFDQASGWQQRFSTEVRLSADYTGALPLPSLTFLACNDQHIYVGGATDLMMLDLGDGEIEWKRSMPGNIAAAKMYRTDTLGLVLSNGIITLCTATGSFSYERGTSSFKTDYNIGLAAISGPYYADSLFLVVPASNFRRTAAFRLCDNKDLSLLFEGNSEQLSIFAEFHASPSGRWIAGLSETADGSGICGVLVDTSSGGKKQNFRFEGLPWYSLDINHVCLTEEGMIVAGLVYLNPFEKTCKALTKNGEVTGKYDTTCISWPFQDPNDGTVLTAGICREDNGATELLLCRNDTLTASVPFPENPEDDLAIKIPKTVYGGNGYIAVSGVYDTYVSYLYSVSKNQWLSVDRMFSEPTSAFALADRQPWLAVHQEDGTLCVYDLNTKKLRFSTVCDLPASKLVFAQDDRLLALFSYEGSLILFDAETGDELQRLLFAYENFHFTADSRYSFCFDDEQDRILILYGGSRPHACFALNGTSYALEGVYIGVDAYLPISRQLIVRDDAGDFYYSPLYSLEEIMNKAEAFLIEGYPNEQP